MIPNHVKHHLRAGQAQLGPRLNFGDPLVAEMMWRPRWSRHIVSSRKPCRSSLRLPGGRVWPRESTAPPLRP